MKIKIIYPDVSKRSNGRRTMLKILKWPFLGTAIACPVVNIAVGGVAWSVIALAGLAMVWSIAFSTDLVEYNRLSQSVKAIFYACIMLVLIDVLIAPGWALFVVPLVCLGGLLLAAVLFFTDLKRQKQNMLPMFMLDVIAIIASVAGSYIWSDAERWPFIAMGGLGVVLLIAWAIVLGEDFKYELQKRFHIK